MSDNKALAVRFHALFAGMERAYGTYNQISLDESRSDGKFKGTALTKRQPVTDDLWCAHLDGVNGIGIVPIRDDGFCYFGAIDIDVYAELNHVDIVQKVQKISTSLIVCRSKSGGCHIYVFSKEAVPAVKMNATLRDIAAQLGHGNAEIFPKQTSKVSESDCASWINMPYFEGERTQRFAVKLNGDAYSPEEFLALAEANKAAADFFDSKAYAEKKAKTASLLPEGPPCLQHLMELGFPEGTWNSGVHNLAIYCRKARPVDWRQHLIQLNAVHFPPDKWPVGDLQQIIHSVASHDYHYQCSKHPLVQYCNKTLCRQRKYGIGGGTSSFPVLGELRMLLTDPEIFFLDAQHRDGHTVTMELTAEQLNSPKAFEVMCTRKLQTSPIMPSGPVWKQTINTLLENVITMDPPPEDSSEEGQFWEALESFCTQRAQAQTRDELLLGKPYTEDGRTYFRTRDLMKSIRRDKQVDMKVHQITKVLRLRKDAEGKALVRHDVWHLANNTKTTNVWSVPQYKRGLNFLEVPDTIKKDELF